MKNKKVYIDTVTKTCTSRNLDSQKIYTYFIENGYAVVNTPQDANLIILVTCASIDKTTNVSLKKIKELQQYEAELIVAGCLSAIAQEKLSAIFKGRIIPSNKLEKIDAFFPENTIKFASLCDTNFLFKNKVNKPKKNNVITNARRSLKEVKIGEWAERGFYLLRKNILKNLFGEHSIAYKELVENQFYIRVAWGCQSKCSYCVIKKAIGALKSKSLHHCVKEFERGLHEAYTHFVITADDVGPYGLDIDSTLPELLERITSYPGDYEITIEALNPFWLIKYYDSLEIILKRQKITALYIPFQSGSKRILQLMNRYSDVENISKVCQNIRTLFPSISLSADIIIGFPTETEEEFKQTLSFIDRFQFNFGLMYRFSSNADTDASRLTPKISPERIDRRFKYAKNYLRSKGYLVFYKPLFFMPRWSDTLGFVKK